MKLLCLVRHAKSSWVNPTLDDAKRPLNERGERDAPRMAKRLKERDITFDLILCSPAQRTQQTVLRMNEILKIQPACIQLDDSLYHASANTLLKIMQQLTNKYNTVMLVGHNPGLTDFANELMNETIDNIPTCGIAVCTVNVESWQALKKGNGKLLFYDYPKSSKK